MFGDGSKKAPLFFSKSEVMVSSHIGTGGFRLSVVFSLKSGEGLTQGRLGGHQNQISGREFRAEDGQELSIEALLLKIEHPVQ